MRAGGARALSVLGALVASALSFLAAAPARADGREADGGAVSISVRIEPLECVSGCGGAPPGPGLPATGLSSWEWIAWVGMVLLVVGAAVAMRARMARRGGTASAHGDPTPYAVLSDAHAAGAASGSRSSREPKRRRENERSGGECPK